MNFWRQVLRSMAGQPFVFPLKKYEWAVRIEREDLKPLLIAELTEDLAREAALLGNISDDGKFRVMRRPVGVWEEV